jgi:hypothetical protein
MSCSATEAGSPFRRNGRCPSVRVDSLGGALAIQALFRSFALTAPARWGLWRLHEEAMDMLSPARPCSTRTVVTGPTNRVMRPAQPWPKPWPSPVAREEARYPLGQNRCARSCDPCPFGDFPGAPEGPALVVAKAVRELASMARLMRRPMSCLISPPGPKRSSGFC